MAKNLANQQLGEDSVVLQYTGGGGPYTVYGTATRHYYRYGGKETTFEVSAADVKQLLRMKRNNRPIFQVVATPETPTGQAPPEGDAKVVIPDESPNDSLKKVTDGKPDAVDSPQAASTDKDKSSDADDADGDSETADSTGKTSGTRRKTSK